MLCAALVQQQFERLKDPEIERLRVEHLNLWISLSLKLSFAQAFYLAVLIN